MSKCQLKGKTLKGWRDIPHSVIYALSQKHRYICFPIERIFGLLTIFQNDPVWIFHFPFPELCARGSGPQRGHPLSRELPKGPIESYANVKAF